MVEKTANTMKAIQYDSYGGGAEALKSQLLRKTPEQEDIMASRRPVRYSPLPTDDYDGGMQKEEDLRFTYNPRALDRVPWRSIALALFLLSLGMLLLILSCFIFTGHMEGEQSQAYGLLTLGILAFLPGFYETRIAYYSWRGAPGYRFSAIPS